MSYQIISETKLIKSELSNINRKALDLFNGKIKGSMPHGHIAYNYGLNVDDLGYPYIIVDITILMLKNATLNERYECFKYKEQYESTYNVKLDLYRELGYTLFHKNINVRIE